LIFLLGHVSGVEAGQVWVIATLLWRKRQHRVYSFAFHIIGSARRSTTCTLKARQQHKSWRTAGDHMHFSFLSRSSKAGSTTWDVEKYWAPKSCTKSRPGNTRTCRKSCPMHDSLPVLATTKASRDGALIADRLRQHT
jgi:hypothetical protein